MSYTKEKLLTPLEAANYLGVTAELIFQFTKIGFGKSSGLRSLRCIELDGNTRISQNELDDFDKLLYGYWCGPNENRPSIPKSILDHLKAESHNQCARCGSGAGVETAHIIPWSKSRSHHPHNLIRVCTTCHREHDVHHSLSSDDLKKIKTLLIERTRSRLKLQPLYLFERFRPPRSSQFFFGRDSDLQQLVYLLQTTQSVLISGIGGVGKSELLLQALQQSETGRTVLWCDIEQYQNVSELMLALRVALSREGIACDENEIPILLDNIRACLVFDSIEQSSLGDLDDFEDALSRLFERTHDTQFVLTSQIQLYRFPANESIRLRTLDELASRLLLQKSYSGYVNDCEKALRELLIFSDGHPLAIKFSGALADYYGGASKALVAIHKNEGLSFGYPGRNQHHRNTSLEQCLNIAYSALSINCRKLLWAISLSPAGLITEFLEGFWSCSADSMESLAILRRWSFLTVIPINEKISRTNLLAPIRQFVVSRARTDENESFEDVVRSLVKEIALTVAVIESSDDTSYVMRRYEMELPNLLAMLKLAKERQHIQEMVKLAIPIASSLMRYFFVSRLPEQGASVLLDVAKMALRSSNVADAASLVMQYMSLASRSINSALIGKGIDLVNQIKSLADPQYELPDLDMSLAIAHQKMGDFYTSEKYARSALGGYLRKLSLQSDGSNINYDACNDLFNVSGVLGLSLLSQNRYQDAKDAYLRALSYERGSWIDVNLGQTLHQLGNCEAYLGNYKSAAEAYLEAFGVFQSVGMKEYVSNSFSELGYTFLNFYSKEIIEELNEEQVNYALTDLAECVLSISDANIALDYNNGVQIIRKIFGTLILVSLTAYGDKLEPHFSYLEKKTVTELKKQVLSGRRDSSEMFPISMIDLIFSLGKAISQGELELRNSGCLENDTLHKIMYIEEIAPDWAHEIMRMSDWLDIYLKYKGKTN